MLRQGDHLAMTLISPIPHQLEVPRPSRARAPPTVQVDTPLSNVYSGYRVTAGRNRSANGLTRLV
jgi:hypothetical protein